MKIIEDPQHKYCGVGRTLKVLGNKWTAMLLHNLFQGKNRFGELQRSMDGISPKTLSIRLKELEKEKIIKKKIFAEVPLRVEYSLTDKGKSLGKIFKEMAKWGERHNKN